MNRLMTPARLRHAGGARRDDRHPEDAPWRSSARARATASASYSSGRKIRRSTPPTPRSQGGRSRDQPWRPAAARRPRGRAARALRPPVLASLRRERFIRVNPYGQVPEVGRSLRCDATDFAIKHGGLGSQQATPPHSRSRRSPRAGYAGAIQPRDPRHLLTTQSCLSHRTHRRRSWVQLRDHRPPLAPPTKIAEYRTYLDTLDRESTRT